MLIPPEHFTELAACEADLTQMDWEGSLGWKEGRIWIPELDELWRKVLRLYHNSLVTGHLGMSGTLELVAWSYWRRNMTDWVM